MWKLFGLGDFLILLLCFQQVHPSEAANSRSSGHDFDIFNSALNHIRSVIETKRLSFDIPVRNESENTKGEDDDSGPSLNDSVTELNQTLHVFKNQFEQQQSKQNQILKQMLNELINLEVFQVETLKLVTNDSLRNQANLEPVPKSRNNFEVLQQLHADVLNSISKNSTDHIGIHDQHLNCLQNCTPLVETAETVCSNMNRDGAFVFKIQNYDLKPFYAYCQQNKNKDNSNWIVIQRREDGSVNFNRGWSDYKLGFGDVYGEYWIGLERLHALTKARDYELQIHLEDFGGLHREAIYSKFSVGTEDEGYMLTLGTYSGNANDSFSRYNSMKFATYDKTNYNSVENWAQKYKGGWWYHDCYNCNLNGQYFPLSDIKTVGGIVWGGWKFESLKRVTMLMRLL